MRIILNRRLCLIYIFICCCLFLLSSYFISLLSLFFDIYYRDNNQPNLDPKRQRLDPPSPDFSDPALSDQSTDGSNIYSTTETNSRKYQ